MTTFSFLEAKVMEVPINREIPLERAELLLKKQNKIANQEKQEMSCTYDLRIDGQVVYESSLVFPAEDFSLYRTIVKEVEEQEFNSEEEKEAFLEWLSKTFADSTYGHVAFVEKVNKDGSILISEMNIKGLNVVSTRTIVAEKTGMLSYVQPK